MDHMDLNPKDHKTLPSTHHCRCCECKECGGFQKLLESKGGLTIYRDTNNLVNNDETGAKSNDTQGGNETAADDNFVITIQNTRNKDLNSAELFDEFDINKVSCPRCRRIMERARVLVEKLAVVEKNEIKCVCDACIKSIQQKSRAPCHYCQRTMKKFESLGLGTRKEDILKKQLISLLADKKTKVEITGGEKKLRAYSDIDITKTLKPKSKYYDSRLDRPKTSPPIDSKICVCDEKLACLLRKRIESDKVKIRVKIRDVPETVRSLQEFELKDMYSVDDIIVSTPRKTILKPAIDRHLAPPLTTPGREKKSPYRSGLQSETVLGIGTTGIRRTRSDESLLTSFLGRTDELLMKNFKYVFPRMFIREKTISRTSAELIRETQARFLAEAEEKIRIREELLEEQLRLKQEKELKKLLDSGDTKQIEEWAEKEGIDLLDIDKKTGKIKRTKKIQNDEARKIEAIYQSIRIQEEQIMNQEKELKKLIRIGDDKKIVEWAKKEGISLADIDTKTGKIKQKGTDEIYQSIRLQEEQRRENQEKELKKLILMRDIKKIEEWAKREGINLADIDIKTGTIKQKARELDATYQKNKIQEELRRKGQEKELKKLIAIGDVKMIEEFAKKEGIDVSDIDAKTGTIRQREIRGEGPGAKYQKPKTEEELRREELEKQLKRLIAMKDLKKLEEWAKKQGINFADIDFKTGTISFPKEKKKDETRGTVTDKPKREKIGIKRKEEKGIDYDTKMKKEKDEIEDTAYHVTEKKKKIKEVVEKGGKGDGEKGRKMTEIDRKKFMKIAEKEYKKLEKEAKKEAEKMGKEKYKKKEETTDLEKKKIKTKKDKSMTKVPKVVRKKFDDMEEKEEKEKRKKEKGGKEKKRGEKAEGLDNKNIYRELEKLRGMASSKERRKSKEQETIPAVKEEERGTQTPRTVASGPDVKEESVKNILGVDNLVFTTSEAMTTEKVETTKKEVQLPKKASVETVDQIKLVHKVIEKHEKIKTEGKKLRLKQAAKLTAKRMQADKKTQGLKKTQSLEYLDVKAMKKQQEEERKEQEEKSKKKVPEKRKKDDGLTAKNIKMAVSGDDLILQLVRMNRPQREVLKPPPTKAAPKTIKTSRKIRMVESDSGRSDLELDEDSLLRKRFMKAKKGDVEVVFGQTITLKKDIPPEPEPKIQPALFQSHFNTRTPYVRIAESEPASTQGDQGPFRYALSDRKYIENGWTMLPTEKIVRKMNVYRMRPSHPEFDWFEHNKSKGKLQYETGELLAEVTPNGRGRWFYKNGRLALEYYDTAEMNAQQRFLIYSSGDPDEHGRSRPVTILGMFDYIGNGIIFDHRGKIRLKYNQSEGVVLDRELGPVTHWLWHSLNEPPELQQVMIDTQLPFKDPAIFAFTSSDEKQPRQEDEEMLAIEFDNYIKSSNIKPTTDFTRHQIRMKALKINDQFSLKVVDQETVYLIFREGSTNIKMNLGMVLDHKELLDTSTSELNEVTLSFEKKPAISESIENLQKNLQNTQNVHRLRTERELRIRPKSPATSVDRMNAAASKPKHPILMTTDPTSALKTKCKTLPTANNLYYNTRLI